MAAYTYDPGLVFSDSTLLPAVSAVGTLNVSAGGASSPVYDLNDNLLANLVTNAQGYVGRFKADISDGVLTFGSVLQPVASIESMRAGLVANTNMAGLAPLASPAFTGTPTGLTAAHVGLGSVNNTSDAAKPVSTAQQAALNLKANLASPTFTGTVAGITKAMVGLANADNTSDLASPISTATQTALDLKASRSELTTYSLPNPIVIAHRCASNVFPEESGEGLDAAIFSGFLPELDLQQLVDGTLVACHDDTVDRTMLGIGTGNVNTKTQAQWRTARIKPAIVGGKTGNALFWEEVLDKYGGRTLLVPELKDTDTATATAYIASIKRRHLEKSVITQCFGYTTCVQLATNGIEAMYLSTNLPSQSGATIKAAGINFVCFSLAGNVTAANVTAFKAAGLKVLFYTVNTLVDQAAVNTLGANGCFTNDPWLSSDDVPWFSGDTFGDGIRPKGMTNFYYSGSTLTDPSTPVQLAGNKLGYSVGVTPIPYTHLPTLGPVTRPCRIAMRLHFGATGGLTTNLGFALCAPGTGFFQDAARTGQNAMNVVVRRNGQLQAWEFVSGAASASVGATPTTAVAGINEVAPTGLEGVVDFVVLLTSTTIQLFAQSPRYVSTSGTAATTPLANGYFNTAAFTTTVASTSFDFYVRHVSSGAGWISDISITPM